MCSKPDKNIKKRFRWTDNLELSLIDIWETKLYDLRRQRCNSHVYADMAAELKILFSEEDNTEFDIEGVDIKTKINNLTQRYRTERKTMGPSGGKRPEWKLFDKNNKILGSLPCNDASLIHESMEPIIYQQLCQPGTSTTTISSEDESGSQYDINVLQNVLDTNFKSESSKASTSSSIPSCATATPIATRKKRSRKYKPYEEIDRELLNEIKRLLLIFTVSNAIDRTKKTARFQAGRQRQFKVEFLSFNLT
ncbi:hypothetical protein FQA39_LY00683 [Lamprigera yunnana]|nr:hypothetical protein FQA39_LY00683 [Lamprigera yunnana]